MEWYLKVLKQYADFKGRARRKEYWMFYLISTLISIVLAIVDQVFDLTFGAASSGVIGTLYSLGILVPTIAVGVRRLHDSGKSGWFLLIPFYNFYLLVIDGEPGENEYGPNPKNPTNELDEIGQKEELEN